MVRSKQDAAWADGIAVARQYAAAHGHFLSPDHSDVGQAPDRCVGKEREGGGAQGAGERGAARGRPFCSVGGRGDVRHRGTRAVVSDIDGISDVITLAATVPP
ncbi:hypothetical protein ACFQ2K_52685 [Streptomyces sanglieri]|uniref:Uncharacterized protein n=1 Tax=Streptomyces sanglieri TaxID=193460 RepID=A0ABW2X7X4_9ACTN